MRFTIILSLGGNPSPLSLDYVASLKWSSSIVQDHSLTVSSPDMVFFRTLISPPPVVHKHALKIFSCGTLSICHLDIPCKTGTHDKFGGYKLSLDQLLSTSMVSK
jgi:hypothetical protein